MALQKVKYLYVDDDGRLIADVEGGRQVTIGITDTEKGKAGGVAELDNQKKIQESYVPNDFVTQTELTGFGFFCPDWGQILSFDPISLRPVRVSREHGGVTYEVDCFVSQELVDAYLAGHLAIGDFVLVLFLDRQQTRAIAFSKVYKTW